MLQNRQFFFPKLFHAATFESQQTEVSLNTFYVFYQTSPSGLSKEDIG